MRDTIDSKEGPLEIIRIFDLKMVPRKLLEQMPEDFEMLMRFNLGLCNDPGNLFYAIVTEDNIIVGFIALRIDLLNKRLIAWFAGVLHKYRGGVRQQISEFINDVRVELKIEKPVVIYTKDPEAFEKIGYSKTGIAEMVGPLEVSGEDQEE